MPAEKIELLRRTVARDTTDDQLELFLHICQRHGLDPFARQVYCVLFNNSHNPPGVKDMVIMTGIDGYRKMAARDHKDFAGTTAAQFTWFDPDKKTKGGARIPESATVTAKRKGGEMAEATAYWEEFAPSDLSTEKAKFWRTMPKVMLEKCAEARALRKCFPGLGDVFVTEEISQRMETQTEEGRAITDANGFDVQGTAVTHQARFAQRREAAQKVGREKKGEHMAGVHMQEQVSQPAEKKERHIELDLSDPDDPIIRGDLAEILPALQEHLKMEWKGDWWHVDKKDMDTVLTFIDRCNDRGANFKVKTTRTTKATNNPAPPQQSKNPRRSQKKEDGQQPRKREPAPPPELVKGTIERITMGQLQTGAPTRQVKIGPVWYSCYNNKLFNFFDPHTGREIEFYVDVRKNIVGLSRVHNKYFEFDGYETLPVRTLAEREAGSPKLWD